MKVDNQKLSKVDQSPAYETLRNLKVMNLDMATIMGKRYQSDQNDNIYDPREAVCDWVVHNIDVLKSIIPDGFPRVLVEDYEYDAWYLKMAQFLGGFVSVLALVALLLVWKYRKTKTMVFAQPIFLELILIGYYLNCIAATLFAYKPSQPICIGINWLYLIGYTMELLPVLVKQTAMNQLLSSPSEHTRLSRKTMLLKVAGVLAMIVAYLIVWTWVDPSTVEQIRRFNNIDSTVEVDLSCAPKSRLWLTIASTYLAAILVATAVLAFQSRHVMKHVKHVNEFNSLATMVYSRFLFGGLRGFCYLTLYVESKMHYNFLVSLQSCISTFDALFAMAIYVFPKIREAMKNPKDYKAQLITSQINTTGSEIGVGMDDLNILVCTGNMGNTEPTTESMEKWIPTRGQCFRVKLLEGNRAPGSTGTFDLIAIGMQEATWKKKSKKGSQQEGGSLGFKTSLTTEKELFNALEEENTVQIRCMIGNILGDEYIEIAEEERGEMRLSIWASRAVIDWVSDIKSSGANTGIGNVLANKGGIVVSMNYQSTRISFVSAHLAAHEGKSNFNTRCENICSILKEGNTYDLHENLDVSISSHHTFILGDLNFRTSIGDKSSSSFSSHFSEKTMEKTKISSL